MQIRRTLSTLTAFLVVALISLPTDALSQRLFLTGGALVSQDTNISDLTGTNPAISGGFMVDLNSIARLRGGLTYQDLTSVDVGVEFHVLGSENRVSPYIYGGYGRFIFGQDTERGLFPVGLGLDYDVGSNVRLKAELAGRWAWTEEVTGGVVQPDLVASFMPTLGLAYKLQRIDRELPGTGVMDDDDDPFGVSSEEENVFGSRDATGASQEFDIEYTKSELVDREPESIRPGQTLFSDPGARPYSSPVTRDNIVEYDDHSDMMRLPSGSFLMGYTGEDPLGRQPAGRKRISVSSFYIDRFPVTNSDYRTFLDEEGQQYAPDSDAWDGSAARTTSWEAYFEGSTYDDYPVVAVDWDNAKAYCEWRGHRLPSEAEWEYAGRGGHIGELFPWPGTRARTSDGQYLANYAPEGQAQEYVFTSPIASFSPNRWGIYDMAGNVYEWVEDAYTPTYAGHSRLDPVVSDDSETDRVVRGGSWNSPVFFISVGVRTPKNQTETDTETGFRCAGDIGQVEGAGARRDEAPPVEVPGTEEAPGAVEQPEGEPEFPQPDEEPEFPDPNL